jgi:hypothetical protein
MNKLNFAPRFAIAHSPDSKTSIRDGMGMYYDHFGEGIVDGFSQFGSFGLTSTQAAPSNIFTPDDAPRYTGRNDIPLLPGGPPQQTVSYPAFPPDNPNTTGFTFNSNGIDGRIKTPYSIAADFSVQRQLGKGWTFEAAYVGRFGRHLLQQRDLAAATDLVDPKSGMDYLQGRNLDVAICAGPRRRSGRYNLSKCLPWKTYFRPRRQVALARRRTFIRVQAAVTPVLRV